MQFLWYQSFIYSQAFPGLSNAETQNIVKDLLLSLPSYKVLSFQGNKLLQVLLDKAKISLRDDTRSGAPSLKTTRFFLDLTSFVAVEKRVASPADLLRFNCQCLGKMTLSGLPQDDYVYFIQSTAEALSASEDVHRHHPDLINSAQITSLREQVATASASMIQVSKKNFLLLIYSITIHLQLLAQSTMDSARSWRACKTILQACLHVSSPGDFLVVPLMNLFIRGQARRVGACPQAWLHLSAIFKTTEIDKRERISTLLMFRNSSGFAMGYFSSLVFVSDDLFFSV